MQPLEQIKRSPVAARVAPFAVYAILSFVQGQSLGAAAYWIYLIKTIIGGWILWEVWSVIRELEWNFSGLAVVAGVAVFVLWVGLDGFYRKFGKGGAEWNPFHQFGAGSSLAWVFVVVRIAGMALIVPLVEEVFYRSFLYRCVVRPDFESVPLGHFEWRAFIVTSVVFGVVHSEWLPGILCGATYQALVIRQKRLGDAIVAHGITNLLLGMWVVWKGAWHFW